MKPQHVASASESAWIGVAEGVAACAAGDLDPPMWLERCLARITARDAEIHAWAHVAAGRARADAKRLRNPNNLPLRGLPIGVKDVIDVAGLPTCCNSLIEAGRIAGADAAAVRRLTNAGAIVVGKTVTTEYAFLTPGPTRNPLDPARTPGGSSSGSAAAVADGHVPAALTTQTGGSTIRPATFCGIVGYKPPFGTVPNDGLRLLAPSIDTIGIHARTVADAAMVASVLEARPRAPVSNTAPHFVRVRLPAEEAAGPGLAVLMTEAVSALRAAGAVVEELAVPALAPLDSAHRVIMATEVAREFRDIMRSDADRLSVPLREFIERGRREPGAALTRAHAAITEAHRALWPIAGAGALLLCPAASGEAPVGLSTTGDAFFCRLWSLLRLGAITIPAARGPDGLPLGVQLVDPSPAGERLFAAAGFAERALAPLRLTCIGRRA